MKNITGGEKATMKWRNKQIYFVYIDHFAESSNKNKYVIFETIEKAMEFLMSENCKEKDVYQCKLYKLIKKATKEHNLCIYQSIYSTRGINTYSIYDKISVDEYMISDYDVYTL